VTRSGSAAKKLATASLVVWQAEVAPRRLAPGVDGLGLDGKPVDPSRDSQCASPHDSHCMVSLPLPPITQPRNPFGPEARQSPHWHHRRPHFWPASRLPRGSLSTSWYSGSVETEGQRALLAGAGAGCDYAQGYLYANPLPPKQFETMLRSRQPDRACCRPARR